MFCAGDGGSVVEKWMRLRGVLVVGAGAIG